MEEPISLAADVGEESDDTLLDVTLRPHRSLPPFGFTILMLLLAGISFLTGMLFVIMGAWPVFGFFGLDVLLVYAAFRLSYRSARQSERLTLRGDTLLVQRIGIRGDVRQWRFHPFWLRVILQQWHGERTRLTLSSHGRRLQIGGFLTDDDRRTLAALLEAALLRYRQS